MEPGAHLRSADQFTLIFLGLLLSSCASNPSFTPASTTVTTNGTGTPIGAQNLEESLLTGARVTFRSSDYYTLFAPSPVTSCAGDANVYYDPYNLNSLGLPLALPINILDGSTTIKPSFIKNISVDITDSNVFLGTNKAFGCSYGISSVVPSPSNCATFDSVNNGFVTIGSSSSVVVSSTSVNTALIGGAPFQSPYSPATANQIVLANALFAPFKVNLPVAKFNLGKVIYIEKTDTTSNPVTIYSTGTDTLVNSIGQSTAINNPNGFLSFTPQLQSGSASVYYWAENGSTSSHLTFSSSPYSISSTGSTVQQYTVDASTGPVVLDLPAATGFTGTFISILKTDSTPNQVRVTPMTGESIIDSLGNVTTGSASSYDLNLISPHVVLLPISNGNGGYYWSTQNPEPMNTSTSFSIERQSQILLLDATNSSLTFDLPSATSNPGATLILERLDTVSFHTITLNPVNSETVLNLATTSATLTPKYPQLTLISTITGTNTGVYYWAVSNNIIYQGSAGYNSGYYTTLDASCMSSGPVVSSDPVLNSSLVGSVYFDIDRTQLGPNEDLLLNLTFFPLDASNQLLNQSYFSLSQTPIIEVHLVKTGQPGDSIRSTIQPRIITYGATQRYPQTAQKLAVIGPPTGQIQQQQIFMPISIDSGIDRIHVQRYQGSIIFIEATLYRMGYK